MIIDLYDSANACIERDVSLDWMFTLLQDKNAAADKAYIYSYDGGPVETVILAIKENDGIFLRAVDVSRSRPLKRDLDTTKKVIP
jgi:hypothetical protein